MGEQKDTRPRMLDATAKLLREHGYDGTSLTDILSKSRAPRGSLYFHFPDGKEQMAAEAIAGAGKLVAGALEALFDAGPRPRDGVHAMFEMLMLELERSDFKRGCPVATVALEAPSAPAVRAACAEALAAWQSRLEAALHGHVADAKETSTVLLCLLEGALVLAKAQRSTEPLVAAEAAARRLLG